MSARGPANHHVLGACIFARVYLWYGIDNFNLAHSDTHEELVYLALNEWAPRVISHVVFSIIVFYLNR